MNITPHVVILIAIAALSTGCETKASPEPGPLERAASREPTLASALALALTTAEPKRLDAPPEAEEPLYEPTLQSDDGITINRLITSPDIEGREPLAASAVFGHDEEKVYAFLDISNESSEAKTVTVFFMGPSGKVSGGVELEVPANAPRWRTWAYTRFADELGLWRVEVRGAAGVLLGVLPFEVAEGC